jgi:hypothetical protein
MEFMTVGREAEGTRQYFTRQVFLVHQPAMQFNALLLELCSILP